ncbi:hypothetical protein ETF27_10045 [Prevotella brunnea]|uniref:Bacterial surface antigen (D15) domain-containing protein n=1 Tax=Prevotella brunnea TaxID=2508867 RepID=A0A5C8GAG1_9BACT|nr:hypothetical protein ETF27_10045 [Prevotella brunnea]
MRRNHPHPTPNHSARKLASPRLTIILAMTMGLVASLLVACSSTRAIPDGEQLYTGMKRTEYTNMQPDEHTRAVMEELDVVLATKPNAALFGSPSMRSPFPIGLWVWNAFSPDTSAFSRWVVRAFGSKPVLMSHVNPELHATVGRNLLYKRGYFNGKINYELLPQTNPKTMKLRYIVNMGPLWTIDSLRYVNFPPAADSLLRTDSANAVIHNGDPFDVATLEKERRRVTTLFRDNGYYYYQNTDASYLADTTTIAGKAIMHLQMADSVNARNIRKWRVNNITINLRKTFMEELSQQRKSRRFTVNYNGKRPPLRTRVIANDLFLRRGGLYSLEKHQESQEKLNATGIFAATNFNFTPHDSTDTCELLDLNIDCLFDKPYDFYVETYGRGKTSGKYGPEIIVGLTKRNAFRGAELLNIRLHGAYEWLSVRSDQTEKSGISDYEYGAEASLQFPRVLNPFQTPPRLRRERRRKKREKAIAQGETLPARKPRQQYFETPMTTISASTNVIKRSKYFKRHIVSGELAYSWRPNERHAFVFKPLTLSYEYMKSMSDRFLELIDSMPYLEVSMADQFIPKTSFQYTYQSPANHQNPINWTTTVSEASNVLAGGYAVFGRSWSEKGKQMFKNPFAQFVKLQTAFTKVWAVGSKSSVAAHINAGMIWAYGNSRFAPYSEQFFVGGANSIRAFNAREIGPGKYRSGYRLRSFVEQTGEIKLQANVEYRPHLVGNLYGALFLDAGNVWTMREDDRRPGSQFRFNDFYRQIALGTGVGIRYNLGFFMIRVDWGIGLHVPYDTERTGFYNIDRFKDAQTLHFAIGLPF